MELTLDAVNTTVTSTGDLTAPSLTASDGTNQINLTPQGLIAPPNATISIADAFEAFKIEGDGNTGNVDMNGNDVTINATGDINLNPSGDIKANGSIVHSSDRRLKKDIEQMQYGLEEILAMKPVMYNWINRANNHKSFGLIAQDLEEVIKEVVRTADDQIGTKAVDYTSLISVPIKALQEQQEIIVIEKSKVEILESRVSEMDTLRTELNSIKDYLGFKAKRQ